MHTTFKLQIFVSIFPCHIEDNFTITAGISQTGTHHFYLPTATFGVTAIHPEQITCKNVGFITARTAANFHHGVATICWIGWNHRAQHLIFQGLDLTSKLDKLFFRHFSDLFIGLLICNHRLIFDDLFIRRIEGFEFLD